MIEFCVFFSIIYKEMRMAKAPTYATKRELKEFKKEIKKLLCRSPKKSKKKVVKKRKKVK